MTHVEQTLIRILSHEWKQQPLKLSHIRLFEEFIHRYALWIDATDNRDWYRGFNLPKLFSDDISNIEKEFKQVNKHLLGTGMRHFTMNFILMSIHWASVLDKGLVPSLDLPDPLEPILVLYERGGQVERRVLERDFFVIDGEKDYRVKSDYWPEGKEAPLHSFDEDYLDQLDEQPLPEQN